MFNATTMRILRATLIALAGVSGVMLIEAMRGGAPLAVFLHIDVILLALLLLRRFRAKG